MDEHLHHIPLILFFLGSRLCDCWWGREATFLDIWSCYWCPWYIIRCKFLPPPLIIHFQVAFFLSFFFLCSCLYNWIHGTHKSQMVDAGRSCYDWWWPQGWQAPLLVPLCVFRILFSRSWCLTWYLIHKLYTCTHIIRCKR